VNHLKSSRLDWRIVIKYLEKHCESHPTQGSKITFGYVVALSVTWCFYDRVACRIPLPRGSGEVRNIDRPKNTKRCIDIKHWLRGRQRCKFNNFAEESAEILAAFFWLVPFFRTSPPKKVRSWVNSPVHVCSCLLAVKLNYHVNSHWFCAKNTSQD
jgi:hypothetical protein